jgi:transcriptional/translational regulatory protein YebC/TACO1
MPEDELLLLTLDSGAEDINFDNEGEIEITTSPENFNQVKEALEAEGVICENAEISKIPETTIEITDVEQARMLLRLMEFLDEHDDVQNTFTNLDISDEVMEQIK